MRKKSILLVDGDEHLLPCLNKALASRPYSISKAPSGEEAIQLLHTRHFDLVITNLSRSGRNGLQVLSEVKNLQPWAGVIMLTGHGDMSSTLEALRLGADDYLLKPCDTAELILRIEQCLEKHKLIEQLRVQNRELAASTAQKTLLLNYAAEGIYGIDLQGRTTFINPAAEKMLGYSAEEIFGKNNHTLIHHTRADGSSYPKEACRMLAAIKQNQKIFTTDEVLWRKDGSSFPVEYSSAPLRQDNKVVGAVIIFTDITERKRQEEKQRQLTEYFRQLQKHQSLNSMAAGIAHNFNNILMAVIGNQELALADMPANHNARSYLEKALTASQRAAKLSTMMLQFLGQGKIARQPFEGTELFKEMIEVLTPQLPPGILLSCRNENQIFLQGDIALIRQALINLVTNAAEAIGDRKGTIILEHDLRYYSESELQQPHTQGNLAAGDYVSLSVIDNGPGMENNVLSRAFEPFFTTKFTGRGMGLATILGIMRNHKGTALLTSQPGKGTTATLLFPAPPPDTAEPGPAAAPAPAKLSGTVLLVDDDQLVRDLGRAYLSAMGFKVLQAADGLAALELFEKQRAAITLVLLDISMPRLNGPETLARIRTQSLVPVIMTTGYSIDQIADQYADIAQVSLIQKPFSLAELKSKIVAALSGAKDPPPEP